MQLNLDDTGGARELASYRISAAREDLEAAKVTRTRYTLTAVKF